MPSLYPLYPPLFPLSPFCYNEPMALRVSKDPRGYERLIVYRKAAELQSACAELTALFPRDKTLKALADQMERSARSVKQNVVEGWMRNSTKEYYDFLGFSIGACVELEEDCGDIIKGIYRGLKGVTGDTVMNLREVERLSFYPLDTRLPPVVQLKLRCKELHLLLSRLQNSLERKMVKEHRLSQADKLNRAVNFERKGDAFLARMMEESGFVRLPDGRVVPKGKEGGGGKEGG